ncbi:MAG: glutamine amidotransferase [Elusimicrobiota bacterium]
MPPILGLDFSAASSMAWTAAMVLAGAAAWHVKRGRARGSIAALRLLTAAALILALLNPTIDASRRESKKPRLLILIDASHSMGGSAGNHAKNPETRLREVTRWLLKNQGAIKKRSRATILAISDGARALEWNNLAGLKPADSDFIPDLALPHAQEIIPAGKSGPRRIWLFSDGVSPTLFPPIQIFSSLGAPLDVIGAGAAPESQRLSIARIQTPDFAFLHQRFSIPFSIKAWGLSGKSVSIKLFRQTGNGRKTEEKQIGQIRIPVSSAFVILSSTLTAQAVGLGNEHYLIQAAANQATEQSRQFKIQIVRQKYRVMLLAGRPSPEYAFLRHFLKSDPNRELVSFVILRNPENMSPIPENELSLIPFPEQEIFLRDISQFDLFIMENFSPARFFLPASYLESLRDYVAKGGALLLIGGENAFNIGGYRGTPLEDILPVKLSEKSPDFINEFYQAHPLDFTHPMIQLYGTPDKSKAAWNALPDLDGFARISSVDPQATVLAVDPREKMENGHPQPVIAVRPYGRGKVMMISTDSTWRWRLGSAGNPTTEDFYRRFWSRAVEYLSGSLNLSKVEFAPLPNPLPNHEPLDLSIRVFDSQFQPADEDSTQIAIDWINPEGKRVSVSPKAAGPGLYRISLTGLLPGVQRLRAQALFKGRPWGKDALKFSWSPSAANDPMDESWLKAAARSGNGRYVNLNRINLARMLARLPRSSAESRTIARFYPFNSPWFALLAAFLFIAEIIIRRLNGHS